MGENNQDRDSPPETSEALELFKPFEVFAKCLLDGFVIVDQMGRIVKTNALFASMTGMKSRQLLKADSLDQVVSLSIGGQRITIKELLQPVTPMRYDEVSGRCSGKTEDLNLIIGLFPLVKDGHHHGAFLLIRDVTAEASLQDKYKEKATKSITDALTGLFNRNYFVDYMTQTITTMESLPLDASQRLCSLIMMDIDFFKKINDRYGHPAGDFVLKETAAILKKGFRKTDMIARYGGEEFLVILPGTDLYGAVCASEKVRQSIHNFKFIYEGQEIPVSMSSGVALINVGIETGEQALARADSALYHSKKNGRNQVTAHTGSNVQPGSSLSASNVKPSAA